MVRFSVLMLVLVGLLGLNWSQQEVQQEVQQETVEFEERFNKSYLEKAPMLNAEFSGLKGFDQAGEPWEIESTRGKYSVYVFGCLT